ncbi:MAG: DUF11 domain-containing protein, partial [Saprospiraceae bacterium]|nr:DUF11 domain-containing protein [Saprospiraceae bacterium]
ANPVITTPTLINSGQPLEYTIRFRNMGTTTLGVIKIVDTLDVEIDPSSFRLVVASHPCAWKIKGAGIVEFYFDPINLPTVAANEAASHGFIRFTVQTIRDLNYGDIIPNDCELIFDNHTPLVTNTATTQIGFVLPGGGLSFGDALMVSPNPAAFAVYCNWQTPAPADGRLRFIDLLGVVRVDVPVSAGVEAMHVDVQTVPSGLYHVVLQAGNLILSNTVIVVHAGIIGN